jgi:hypothetical protein
MTSFLDTLGASSNTYVDNGMFYKEYFGLDNHHWKRIKKVSQLASDLDISPKLLEIDDVDMVLAWEVITPFEQTSSTPPKSLLLSIPMVRDRIRQKVGQLHSAGYCHGDLHMGNIGFKGVIRQDIVPLGVIRQDVFFLDFDTCFKIRWNKPQRWVKKWMKIGFDEDSYDTFVENDWNTWETDFLYIGPKREEYISDDSD